MHFTDAFHRWRCGLAYSSMWTYMGRGSGTVHRCTASMHLKRIGTAYPASETRLLDTFPWCGTVVRYTSPRLLHCIDALHRCICIISMHLRATSRLRRPVVVTCRQSRSARTRAGRQSRPTRPRPARPGSQQARPARPARARLGKQGSPARRRAARPAKPARTRPGQPGPGQPGKPGS